MITGKREEKEEDKEEEDIRKRYRVDRELLRKRREMSEQELEERRYCCLRIGEFLDTNMLREEGDHNKVHMENFLDPGVSERVLEMESWQVLREQRAGYGDPCLKAMAKAFKDYAINY